jgi:hypothetical protein
MREYAGVAPLRTLCTSHLCRMLTHVQVTIVLSFTRGSVEIINVFFGINIILISIPQIILVYWFRKGHLTAKFRYLIVYMMFTIIAFCACSLAYLYKKPSCS